MEFRVLGPVEAWAGGGPVNLGHAQRRAVLTVLVLDLGRVVGSDWLMHRVWGNDLPPSARNALHGHVTMLRKVIGAAGEPEVTLERRAGGYVLEAPPESLDVLDFRKLTAQAAQAGDDERAESLLRAATGLWRGRALDGVTSPWLERARAGLEQQRQAATLHLYQAGLRLGRHDELTAELAEASARAPADEGLAELLMLALYRSGRPAEGLRWFERLRQSLAEELGADPGPSIRRLHEQILRSDPALEWDAPPRPAGHGGAAAAPADPATSAAAATPATPDPHELPAEVSAFTGRAREMAELDQLLGTESAAGGAVVISAVSGTAGVGKTALAVRWAHRMADQFPDGQLYVNLRGYDPGQPVPANDALAGFLQSLGVPGKDIPAGADARAARYRSLLAGRRMLVLLDNAGSAEQVRPLLPGVSGCRVLVTSRDALTGLVARDGARRLDLDLLPEHDAAELLRTVIGSRAQQDPASARLLAARCARLPLALRVAAELAVSRPGLSLADLAGELADERRRLDMLDADGDPRTAVRAVFSWSCRHLRHDTVRGFALLGLHPGPDFEQFSAAALAGIALAESRRLLEVLERAHLIQPSPGGPGRYAMHDLLRAYARELAFASEDDAAQREAITRLLRHYAAAAAAAMDTLYPAERQNRPAVEAPAAAIPPVTETSAARSWVDDQRLCLAAAVRHAVTHGWPGEATRLAGLLYRDLFYRGHLALTVAVLRQALTAARLLGDRAAEITALIDLGGAEVFGHFEGSRRHLRQALALAREAGDQAAQVRALGNLGNVDLAQCRYQDASGYFDQALALARQTGNKVSQAFSLMNLGTVRINQGRPAEAIRYKQQALAIARETGDRSCEAHTLTSLGHCEIAVGSYEQAARSFRQGLPLARTMGDQSAEAAALGGLGRIQSARGAHRQAATLLQRAVALFHDFGYWSGEAEMLVYLGEALTADGRFEDARESFATATTIAGRAEDEHERAHAHSGLASCCDAAGDREQARHHWQEALDIFTRIGSDEADGIRDRLAAAFIH